MTGILQENIVLYYKGKLDYDIIGELIQELKAYMSVRNVRFGLYKKLLTLMIETLENVIRYHENFIDKTQVLENHPSEFQIKLKDECYTLVVSNVILNEDVDILSKRLDGLNKLDKKEIKELYKKTITDGKFSEKGGAGLGMIEMAKLADRKPEYSFREIDKHYSYFILQLFLKSAVIEK